MSLIPRSLIAGALLLATLAMPTFAQDGRGGGGFGGGFGGGGRGGGGRGGGFAGQPWAGGQLFGSARNPAYTRMVVLSNADSLSPTVRAIVAAEMVHKLNKSNLGNGVRQLQGISLGGPMGVVVEGFNAGALNLGDDSVIQGLTINFSLPEEEASDREFTEEDEARFAKLWDRGRQELEAALRKAQERIAIQKAKNFDRKRDAIEARLLEAKQELAQVIHNIDVADQQGSPEQLRHQLERARMTLRDLALDRVSVDARREAIVARVDELRRAGKVASEDDPLIGELEKIVEIRARQLENVREATEQNVVSASELDQAESEIAKARVELFKAQRTTVADAAGGVMHELNNELSRLIVQLAEIDARTMALEVTVKELRQATSASATAEAEALNHKLLVLKHRVGELEESKAQLESQAPIAAAEITITPLDEALSLGGENEQVDENDGGDDAPQNE